MRHAARRHWQLLVGALCVLGVVFFALLAVQFVRWPAQLSRDDRLFQITPNRPGLWQLSHDTSSDPSKWLLGIGDDLAYRSALQQFWVVRPFSPLVQNAQPPAQSVVTLAQTALSQEAVTEQDPFRRSQILNLSGALQLNATLPNDRAARQALLRAGINDFLNAIRLDPSNDDAKENLELTLRLYQDEYDRFFGHGGLGGPTSGSASGIGAVGSGY